MDEFNDKLNYSDDATFDFLQKTCPESANMYLSVGGHITKDHSRVSKLIIHQDFLHLD